MKKLLSILFITLFSLPSFAQSISNKMNFGLYYVASVPTSPFGFGYSVSGKKIGFYNNYTFGSGTHLGTDHVAHNNEGIYQLNSIWGNTATGVTDRYITNDNYTITGGITYKVFTSKSGLSLKPYVGVGITKYTSTEYNFIQAEDVSSGFNTLGYYWLNDKVVNYTASKINISTGIFITKGLIQFGIGYETEPNGLQISLGFNF